MQMNLHLGGVNCKLEKPIIKTDGLMVIGVHLYKINGFEDAVAAAVG